MKKAIILAGILLVSLSCKAQQIVPVEKLIEYRHADNGIPDGVYLKDVNNLLNKYLGTWTGSTNGKKYTFVITKFKKDLSGGTYIDELRIRYLITTSNGAVLEDTRNLPNDAPYVIEGDYFGDKKASYYVSNYMGRYPECGQSGNVYIVDTKTPTQITLFLIPNSDLSVPGECPENREQVLPVSNQVVKDVILLTKQ